MNLVSRTHFRALLRRMKDQVTQFVRSFISSAPKKIPSHQIDQFTMNSQATVHYSFRDDSFSPSSAKVFTAERITSMMAMARGGESGSYVQTDYLLFAALKKYESEIRGKEAVDFGSVNGWYSAVNLAYGAANCTIIEYNKLISEHPRVRAVIKADFDKAPHRFDFGTSISSFEHDGLGRYGDPIDPDGDLRAMRETAQTIKAGGLLFLAVPVGRDAIVWNLHRIYGSVRLRKLLDGWDWIDSFGFNDRDFARDVSDAIQPVFVLRNRTAGN